METGREGEGQKELVEKTANDMTKSGISKNTEKRLISSWERMEFGFLRVIQRAL